MSMYSLWVKECGTGACAYFARLSDLRKDLPSPTGKQPVDNQGLCGLLLATAVRLSSRPKEAIIEQVNAAGWTDGRFCWTYSPFHPKCERAGGQRVELS